MNKAELIESISGKTGQSKAQTQETLDALIDVVKASAKKGEDIVLVGFGTFSTKKRPARTGRNPQTGETMKIAAKKVLQFKTSSALNAGLNPAKK